MPHLSPMHWIMATTSFWLAALIMTSLLWWSVTLQFTTNSLPMTSAYRQAWKWL